MVLCFAGNLAGTPVLGSRARISLITCGAGEALYEAFGHSAIRISDPDQGLDVVFNYGVFDFNQENFYLNFAQGNMLYRLGISQTQDFIYSYRYYGRSVREQVLNLDSAERLAVFQFLDQNLLPENCNYLYNYFRDNCSTKIPQMLDSALGGRITWNHSQINGKTSYRSLIYDYTAFQPWGRLGIDLGLGAVIDGAIEGKDLNFLPFELEKSFNRAVIRKDMTAFPLVLEQRTLFEAPVFFGTPPFISGPDFVFTLIFLLTMAAWFFSGRIPALLRSVRALLFFFSGLLGLVECGIWFFTNHTDAAWNFNLLWACPMLLPAGFLGPFQNQLSVKILSFLKYYFLLLVACWVILPQTLNTSLIPLVMAMAAACLPERKNQVKAEVSISNE